MSKNSYCSNCGKYGHINKICSEPIISVGILCVMLDDSIKNILKSNITDYDDNITNYNYKRLSNISKLEYYKDKIKFLLIERKHSLNYIEFIRGLYDVNDNNKLIKMFSLMSIEEHNMIKNNNFTQLWNNLWQKTAKKKEFKREFIDSKNKFNYLLKNNIIKKMLEIGTKYASTEWEIPKGRRNNNETNIECAKREFFEETGYNEYDYTVLNNLYSISDDFVGTNGKNYKHIYYISLFTGEEHEYVKSTEVNKTNFLSWDDAIIKVRPYYQSKIKILNDIFLLFLNLAEEKININQNSI